MSKINCPICNKSLKPQGMRLHYYYAHKGEAVPSDSDAKNGTVVVTDPVTRYRNLLAQVEKEVELMRDVRAKHQQEIDKIDEILRNVVATSKLPGM